MLSAGLVKLPWRRFAAHDLGAGVLWAAYAGLIGLVGGRAFADKPVHALLAFGLAVTLTLLIEVGRRLLGAATRT
jgi:membrane protein DedA with SNARE-associated domain